MRLYELATELKNEVEKIDATTFRSMNLLKKVDSIEKREGEAVKVTFPFLVLAMLLKSALTCYDGVCVGDTWSADRLGQKCLRN